MADVWTDAQKSLETIADEEVTKKILIQYFQNLTLFFFFNKNKTTILAILSVSPVGVSGH